MNKYNELIKKGVFTIVILLLFYIGQGIPVPGYTVDFTLSGGAFSLEKMLAITTGGLFSSPTLFTLGMGPYMTVSILLSVIIFSNRELSSRFSQEERGHIEIVGIFFIAVLQSIPLAFNLKQKVIYQMNFFSTFEIFLFTILCFVVGSLLVSWLASLNVTYGLGGPFVLILPGIMKGMIGSLAANYNSVISHFGRLIIFILISVAFIVISVVINSAEYKFNIKRIGLDNCSNDTYMAFRILVAGSMPLMFATTLMYFPAYIMQLFNLRNESILSLFSMTHIRGILMYGIILYLLGILFSFVTVMPDQISKDLKESGDYIIGVTPGKETKKYINKHVWGVTVIGSLFLPLIVIIPLLVGILTHHPSISNMSNYFAMIFVLVVLYDSIHQDAEFLLYKNTYKLFNSTRREYK